MNEMQGYILQFDELDLSANLVISKETMRKCKELNEAIAMIDEFLVLKARK